MLNDSVDRYYRVDVQEGAEVRPAYFYSTIGGLHDLQYGWGKYTSWAHESLASAIDEFRRSVQAKHDTSNDGVAVTVSGPVEVTKDEVDRHSPHWGALVERATNVIKKAIARSIDPINVTLAWEWIDDPSAKSLVRLKLSAEMESVAEEFSPGALKDDLLMRDRILRLYSDLLQKLTDKALEPIRESILEHRRG
jgi:hypothetical protein